MRSARRSCSDEIRTIMNKAESNHSQPCFRHTPLPRRCWRFVPSVASQRVRTRQNTLKRTLPARMERAEKHSRKRACASPNRYAKPAPQKSKNRPATNRSQSSQRASTFSIGLTRKVCDVTIGRAESPALFRTLRRSREKAAAKQEKAPGSQASPSRSHLPAVRAVSSFHAGRSNLSLD